MQTTTANYDTAIKAVTREIRAYLKFNGSTIVRGVDGLISINWNQELSDTERFSIGQAVSSYIDTELYSTAVSGVTLETAYIDAYIGIVLSYANSKPAGSIEDDFAVVEYVPLGRFYVNTVEKAKNTVRITAYDAMSKLAGDYTTTVTPGGSGYAITDIANDVLTQCGISGSVSGSHGYATKISPGTCREQLGWCCSMIYSNGSSFIINRANNTLKNTTVIGQSANQYTITDNVIFLDGADIQPSFTITSVEATAGENTYSYGTGVGVVTSNPYITTAQTQAIYNSLKNFTYTPMKIEFRGDPKLDVGDVITVTTGGTSYTCVIMRLLNTFNGGLKTTIYCYGNSEEYYEMSQSPTGARIIQTQDMVRIEAQRATDAEGVLQGSITTNANNITLAVSNTPIVNILPSVYYRENIENPYANNGITWTVNPDGSVTATGLASANSDYYLTHTTTTNAIPRIKIDPTRKYTISGVPNTSGTQMRLGVYNSSGTLQDTLVIGYGTAPGVSRTIAAGYYSYCPYLRVTSGTDVTGGVTFYPQIEVGDTVHEYASTHMGTGALSASVKVNADNITLKVSKDSVISEINQSAEQVKIQAAKVDLVGQVTISDLDNNAKGALQTGTSVKNQYYISTSSSSATGGSWADTTAAWSSGKYVWTRVVTTKTYADGNSTTTNGTAVYDANLTAALSTANTAASDASTAITNAGTAQTTANNAIANTPIVNLLPSVYRREAVSGTTWTGSGITWTVNNDGSVTASGTATGTSVFNLSLNVSTESVPWIIIDPTKKHTMSGVPNVVGCKFRVQIFNSSGAAVATYTADTTSGSGTSRTIPTGYYYAYAYLQIDSGTAIPNGVTFYPQLEVGDTAHAYVSTHNGSGALALTRDAVFAEQIIYKSAVSGTTTMSGTTTWVTDATGAQATWTTKRPQYASAYPVLFVATQTKVVDGTVTCTTPMIDDTTTIIDGGNIITGTVTANKIAANETFTQKLYAQDFNITGGSVSITTANDTTDAIKLIHNNKFSYMSPTLVSVDNTTDGDDYTLIRSDVVATMKMSGGVGYPQAQITSTGNLSLGNASTNTKGAISVSDGTNTIIKIGAPNSNIEVGSGAKTKLYYDELRFTDSSNVTRADLLTSGLTFNDSNGNVTATYPASGFGGTDLKYSKTASMTANTAKKITFSGQTLAIIAVTSGYQQGYATYVYNGYGNNDLRQHIAVLNTGTSVSYVINADQSISITSTVSANLSVIVLYGSAAPTIS